MEYKIKKGDSFLCLEDYEMDDERISYTKGKMYKSDLDGRITDNEFDVMHEMEGQNDFFEYFELVLSDNEIENNTDKLIIGFYNFLSEKYTCINGLFDLKDTPYWAFNGKTIEEILLIFKNET